jgi:hypothetical protein
MTDNIITLDRSRMRETNRMAMARVFEELAAGVRTGEVPTVTVSWKDLDNRPKHRSYGQLEEAVLLSDCAHGALRAQLLNLANAMPLPGEIPQGAED